MQQPPHRRCSPCLARGSTNSGYVPFSTFLLRESRRGLPWFQTMRHLSPSNLGSKTQNSISEVAVFTRSSDISNVLEICPSACQFSDTCDGSPRVVPAKARPTSRMAPELQYPTGVYAMSTTGLEVFDRAVHKTNIWLKDFMEMLDYADRHEAYLALRATLHALRERLTIDEVAQFAAQLPMLVRGF